MTACHGRTWFFGLMHDCRCQADYCMLCLLKLQDRPTCTCIFGGVPESFFPSYLLQKMKLQNRPMCTKIIPLFLVSLLFSICGWPREVLFFHGPGISCSCKLPFCFQSLSFSKFNVDEPECVSVSVCICVCLCVCPSQPIPRKLLKSSSNLALWLPQTWQCITC